MKTIMRSSVLMLLLLAAAAHAQTYKWVGADGKITYSDTPPPSSARQVEQKATTGAGGADSGLPYELAEAAKAHPVTLYTTKDCAPCDQGRALLTTRGIPFAEKTVATNDDLARLREAGGDGQLPLLRVGRSKQDGFQAGGWNDLLTAAGYPQSNRLPAQYRQRTAEPAAPAAAKPVAAKTQARKDTAPEVRKAAAELPPASGNAPPGFRF